MAKEKEKALSIVRKNKIKNDYAVCRYMKMNIFFGSCFIYELKDVIKIKSFNPISLFLYIL